jgi:hypothetical protein
MPASDRATGKDIILDIVENMRAYQEELLYSSVVPTAFEVHLHPTDHDRLEGIFATIAAEARRALDEALSRRNRQPAAGWLKKLGKPAAPVKPAHEGWSISFHRDENDELRPGEVLVDSKLTVSKPPELGAGARTRRITTSRIGTETSTRSQVTEEAGASGGAGGATAVAAANPQALPPLPAIVTTPAGTPIAPVAPVAPVAPAALAAPPAPAAPAAPSVPSVSSETTRTAPVAFATLTYEDNSGRHTHVVKETQLMIGRGGAGYWVDLKIDSAKDVSREHVRLRRDEVTGQFFAKDLSTYGTTINGQRIASSIETSNGAKRDINLEVPLPPIARIGLADMVYLEFRLASAP